MITKGLPSEKPNFQIPSVVPFADRVKTYFGLQPIVPAQGVVQAQAQYTVVRFGIVHYFNVGMLVGQVSIVRGTISKTFVVCTIAHTDG
jgi:hypothetical protein